MLKVNHAIYNNIEIEDYRAQFLTYSTTGMGGEYQIFKTLQEAESHSDYGEIYICFKLKNK